MKPNSFRDLEVLHEQRYKERTRHTQKKIHSSIRIFHFIGDIVELFLPKVFQVFVSASGGDDIDYAAGPSTPSHVSDSKHSKYPDTNQKH